MLTKPKVNALNLIPYQFTRNTGDEETDKITVRGSNWQNPHNEKLYQRKKVMIHTVTWMTLKTLY